MNNPKFDSVKDEASDFIRRGVEIGTDTFNQIVYISGLAIGSLFAFIELKSPELSEIDGLFFWFSCLCFIVAILFSVLRNRAAGYFIFSIGQALNEDTDEGKCKYKCEQVIYSRQRRTYSNIARIAFFLGLFVTVFWLGSLSGIEIGFDPNRGV